MKIDRAVLNVLRSTALQEPWERKEESKAIRDVVDFVNCFDHIEKWDALPIVLLPCGEFAAEKRNKLGDFEI